MPFTATYTGIGDAPRLLTVDVIRSDRLLATFSESMDSTGFDVEGNYTLTEDLGSTARTVASVEVVNTFQVLLYLDGDLTPGTDNYDVTAAGLTDVALNPIDPLYDTITISGPTATVETLEMSTIGGGPFTILSSAPAGTYTVHVGPLEDTDDPKIYNGIPGTGGDAIEFDGTSGVGYLPPLPVGTYAMTFVPAIGLPFESGPSVVVYPTAFANRTILLRRILPPWYKVGPRFPETERAS